MKKRQILIIFLLFFFLLFSLKKVYSQIAQIPGTDCGNAEATEADKKKCCQPVEINVPEVPDWLNVPVISDFLTWLATQNQELKRADNVIYCAIGYPSNPGGSDCVCIPESMISPTPIAGSKTLCDKYISSTEISQCQQCANNGGVYTSIGCIYGNVNRFITETLLGWGISLAGITALLCIIYSAFQIQTSQGNAEKVKKAQELLTSCIMGLMLIIFSIFILRLIGVSILKIPGLS